MDEPHGSSSVRYGGNNGGPPTGDTNKAGRDGSITATGNGPTSDGERAAWHAKARAAGLSLSDLARRSLGRVRTRGSVGPGCGTNREPDPTS